MLRVAGTRIGAVIVPSELPAVNLRLALDAMRRLVPGGELTFLGAGRDPGLSGRERAARGRHPFAAFDPIDPHTLRFQVNRALAGAKVQIDAPAPHGARACRLDRSRSAAARARSAAVSTPSPRRGPSWRSTSPRCCAPT